MSGFGAGTVTAKKNKGKKKFESETEEEYPEMEEEYDEELTGEEEEWEGDAPEGRYAPINTRITISKVAQMPLREVKLTIGSRFRNFDRKCYCH